MTQSTRLSVPISSGEMGTDAESVPIRVQDVQSTFITDSSGVTVVAIRRTTWYLRAETATIISTPETTTGRLNTDGS